MDLHFDKTLVMNYKSESQKIRVMSENWMKRYMFCPNCGLNHINKYPNNQPVADFFCESCGEIFELKSKKHIGKKIVDGAYNTAIARITSSTNPDLFILQYANYEINNLEIIPKYFFIPDIIERRKPLSNTARRAGWVGSNILYFNIPVQGKIAIIKDRIPLEKDEVVENYKQKNSFKQKILRVEVGF
jgi:type II restriction enzyme